MYIILLLHVDPLMHRCATATHSDIDLLILIYIWYIYLEIKWYTFIHRFHLVHLHTSTTETCINEYYVYPGPFLHVYYYVLPDKMAATMMPRDAGRYIAENSKDVFIKSEGVTKVAKVMAECIKSGTYSIKSWKQHELNPKEMDNAALDWVFFADTLNFSFWSPDDSTKYMVKYKGKEYTGYWSLCAAMNRAIDEGKV